MEVTSATVNLGGQECCGAGGRHRHLHQEGKAQVHSGEHSPWYFCLCGRYRDFQAGPRHQLMNSERRILLWDILKYGYLASLTASLDPVLFRARPPQGVELVWHLHGPFIVVYSGQD